MTSAALKQLTDLHRAMYERAYADARESLGDSNSKINRYAEEFSKSLPDTFKSVPARRISQAIDSHKFILFGDFHSHKQCQRALLRIIRTYNNTPDHAPMGLALEMFRTVDQPVINEWQEGRISDEELLDRTEYDRIWGFPWANYRPLLEYCRNHSIPLFAANTKNAGKDSLLERDKHAAEVLQGIAKRHPRKKLFYIVGEYHLADSHLSKAIYDLDPGADVLRIIANSDKYFFKMPQDKIHRKDEFLELTKSFYCILNSPPWMKWQSQTLVEELRKMGTSTYITSEIADEDDETYDLDFEEEEDFYTEDVVDLDTHLRHTVDTIADFLKIKNRTPLQDSFKIVSSVDHEDIEHLPAHARATIFAQSSREGIAAEFGRRILFLSELSINNLAFSAGLVIFGSLSHLKEDYDNPQNLFISQTLKLTFGHFANKILNPRVALHSRKAMEDYLGAIRGKHVIGPIKMRRDVARATLKFLDWASDALDRSDGKSFGNRLIPMDILLVDQRSAHDVSRHIAQTITSSLYQKMLAGKIDATDLSRWFSKRCDTPTKAAALLVDLLKLT